MEMLEFTIKSQNSNSAQSLISWQNIMHKHSYAIKSAPNIMLAINRIQHCTSQQKYCPFHCELIIQ